MITRLYRLYGAFEICFYAEHREELTVDEYAMLLWLIAETFEPEKTGHSSFLRGRTVEIGPRLSVETPFSSNAVSICRAMGLGKVTRIERGFRYPAADEAAEARVLELHLDRMTQVVYPEPIESFDLLASPSPVRRIPVLENGEDALRAVNSELGLGMDADDIGYYVSLFKRLGRNPTDVELFQIANGNSEHCRHHFFRGRQIVDGRALDASLFDIVREPLRLLSGFNVSVLAFNDNTGAITGAEVDAFLPARPGGPSPMTYRRSRLLVTGTAETHNHPTLIAPFPGAETGAGGRIRDNSASGRGSLPLSGLAGYATGNLFIPGHAIPGEAVGGENVLQHASPLDILIQGSNGVSAYGNEFGEPLIGGFTRTFGMKVRGERREFRKPILWTGGIGRLFDIHAEKHKPSEGMKVVRIGGPAYRIGVGGGSASSMMQGTNSAELDFKSVQRGNAEMQNRANRVITTCVEMGLDSPIESIHDQGAGGPSNVLTELLEPAGGRIDIRKINLGDRTMSVLEIWSAEFQEGYGILVRAGRLGEFQKICERERVNCEVVGDITGDGKVVVVDSADGTEPVSLELADILTKLPPKTFTSTRRAEKLPPLVLPQGLTASEALRQVFLLPSVGSKGYLVRKVDRSVTGRVVGQQCSGPAQIPIADVQVMADGYAGLTGSASSIGEQPIKMLIDPKAGARMAVGEMLTNMASVGIDGLSGVRTRANWMWPAKLPHEGALICDAVQALSDIQIALGIASDGGKDSLSMAAQVGGERIKSPGSLVVLGYAFVPDVTRMVTPDLKGGTDTQIGLIDLGEGRNRLGGSALAQAYGQIGDESPDVDNPDALVNSFEAVQELVKRGLLLSLHDRSDGGLATALSEMCMAGQKGMTVSLQNQDVLAALFSEELGIVFEFRTEVLGEVFKVLSGRDVPFQLIGRSQGDELVIQCGGEEVLRESVASLRTMWEATSTALERLQANPETVESESRTHARIAVPKYELTFKPAPTAASVLGAARKPKIAVIREEGTNGDREMAAAFDAAGFEAWDMAMNDLLRDGEAGLDEFRGVVFPGGFSFMDVCDSAKGWAGSIRFNPRLSDLFERFYERSNTFSLGVCNGCQLMALLGWVPFRDIPETSQPRFVHNVSGRFESRWAQVRILRSPSVMLSGMAGSTFGVWVAHGEGKLVFPDPDVALRTAKHSLAPMAYVDPEGEFTEEYPYNPNGSPGGFTALCSEDGRHLAMMPHPERCFRKIQWPWMPEDWRNLEASPWLRMFQNARDWCA